MKKYISKPKPGGGGVGSGDLDLKCHRTRDGGDCLKCASAAGVDLVAEYLETFPKAGGPFSRKAQRVERNRARGLLGARMQALGHTCVDLRDAVFFLRDRAGARGDSFATLPFDEKSRRDAVIGFLGRAVLDENVSEPDLAQLVRVAHTVFELAPRSPVTEGANGSFGRELKLLAISLLISRAPTAATDRPHVTTTNLTKTVEYMLEKGRGAGKSAEKIKFIARV